MPITGSVSWTKTDLSGAGTIGSTLVNFDSLPDPFNPGDSATIQVSVGPIPDGQAAGFLSKNAASSREKSI